MIVIAAPGDTWGIPGPTFLDAYVMLATIVVVGSMIYRTWLFNGRHGDHQPGPQEVAFLNGGERLAAYTSLGALRSAGAVAASPGGFLSQTGHLPFHPSPLDRAVYEAAGRGTPARGLVADSAVSAALCDLREHLEARGLLLSPAARRWARVGPLIGLALIGVGIARVAAGVANDKPVSFLVLALMATIPFVLVQLARTPVRTRAARGAVRQLRRQYAYLTPSKSPAYATYGVAGVAMGVALFGAASLWALDPGFAAEAELERNLALSGGGMYSGSSGGTTTGCTSSCSSGGDSSCGGSSCGGGGCGGGGCGG